MGEAFNKHEDKHAFTAHAQGQHTACFKNIVLMDGSEAEELTRRVEMDLRVGAKAQDFAEVAKSKDLRAAEAELTRLERNVEHILQELVHLKIREARFRETSTSTYSRVAYFALFNIVVMLTLGTWQLVFFKKFFRQKKII